jgi:hypothetical protein
MSDILKSKFASIVFSGRHGKNILMTEGRQPQPYVNDFIFRFNDTSDEDFFVMWSYDGIEI